MFELKDGQSFSDVVAMANPTKPQLIVGGWFNDNGMPVGGVAVQCSGIPTQGEMLVSTACCLCACLTKLEEITKGDSKSKDAAINLVIQIVGGLEVVKRMRNDFFKEDQAPAGSLFA